MNSNISTLNNSNSNTKVSSNHRGEKSTRIEQSTKNITNDKVDMPRNKQCVLCHRKRKIQDLCIICHNKIEDRARNKVEEKTIGDILANQNVLSFVTKHITPEMHANMTKDEYNQLLSEICPFLVCVFFCCVFFAFQHQYPA